MDITFFAEVSVNMGQEALANYLSGKYHQPKQEERIFMFLDMKSSTTIAEKIGHLRYFQMLREYYSDLSDPVIRYMGEIYQYVGDEMIISWNLKSGTLDNNCLKCFYAMKTTLQQRSKTYKSRYGVVPSFKAGLHYGLVTTGEIGRIKKDIIFTGDVMNTTARIQGLCNDLGAELLISGPLVERLKLERDFITESHGGN